MTGNPRKTQKRSKSGDAILDELHRVREEMAAEMDEVGEEEWLRRVNKSSALEDCIAKRGAARAQ